MKCQHRRFTTALSEIFEDAPWIVERALPDRPFTSIRSLYQALVEQVGHASEREQLALLRAQSGMVDEEMLSTLPPTLSTDEQQPNGLEQAGENTVKHVLALKNAYEGRYGFPFTTAGRVSDLQTVRIALEQRLEHSVPDEQGRSSAPRQRNRTIKA